MEYIDALVDPCLGPDLVHQVGAWRCDACSCHLSNDIASTEARYARQFLRVHSIVLRLALEDHPQFAWIGNDDIVLHLREQGKDPGRVRSALECNSRRSLVGEMPLESCSALHHAALLDDLTTHRIEYQGSDPRYSIAGGFLRRFKKEDLERLDQITDDLHREVWRRRYGRKKQAQANLDLDSHIHHVYGNQMWTAAFERRLPE